MQEAWSILRPLLLEIVLPGVAASAATLLFLSLLTRWLRLSPKFQFWQTPLAVAVGLLAGNYYRQDIPYWSLEHDFYSLIPASLAMLLLSTIGQWHREAGRRWLSLLSHAAGALLVAIWLTPADAPGSRWLWVGLLFVAMRANEHALCGVWNDALGRTGPALLALFWGGVAGVTLLAFVHAMRYFDLVAIFSSALLGVGIIALFVPCNVKSGYAAPAMFFPAMMLFAQLSSFTDVPLASFLLLAIAPGAILLALPEMTTMLEKCSTQCRIAAALLLLCIPLAAALTMAAMSDKSQAEAAEQQIHP